MPHEAYHKAYDCVKTLRIADALGTKYCCVSL